MPNNTRTQLDGVWIDGYAPPPEDWADLERKIFNSWNGDTGAVYGLPQAAGGDPWSFGGSGLQVTGPTRLTYGGTIKGGTNAFVIRDGTWPTLGPTHGARTRSIVCPIHTWTLPVNVRDSAAGVDNAPSRSYLWSTNHPYVGVGSVALACRLTNGSEIETADLYIPLRVIDGAVLTKVAIYFRVVTKREVAPIAMPKLRILRVPRDSGDKFDSRRPEPLKATDDGRGFDFLPLVTDPNTWYNGGDVQLFEYVCDQNHVIDVENYSYVAHLVEEQGALTVDDPFDGFRYVERKKNVNYVGLNTLTLNGAQDIDTATNVPPGRRVLIVDSDSDIANNQQSAFASKNGIWLTTSSDWTRTTDLDDTQDFSPNWIVIAIGSAGGTNFGGTSNLSTWQGVYPTKAQQFSLTTGVSADDTKASPRIQPAVPKGNIYHALVPTFEVSDLRFQ